MFYWATFNFSYFLRFTPLEMKNCLSRPISNKNGLNLAAPASSLYLLTPPRTSLFSVPHSPSLCWLYINGVYCKKTFGFQAQKHILVLARAIGLDGLGDVHQEHLPILRTMHAVGLKWAETFLKENKSLIFRLGYHSAPSMRQLHLHVISQDFDSKHFKNKKHWNSFNSLFFRDSEDVIREVNEQGKPTLNDNDKFLSMELRCNRCRSAHPNIPRLKSHINICKSPFPVDLLQNGRLLHTPMKDEAC